jgi:hypothetical protein
MGDSGPYGEWMAEAGSGMVAPAQSGDMGGNATGRCHSLGRLETTGGNVTARLASGPRLWARLGLGPWPMKIGKKAFYLLLTFYKIKTLLIQI